MPSKKRVTPISLQPLDALFGTNEETTNGISEIAIGSLHPFTNHPFQVRDDKKMEELAESITQYGVLVPGIVRLRESGGYELVAGHRRKRACELAGLEKMPVIIKDLTDDEATVIMVDSNIQREELLISEKAFAYKMKYEALKRQGKRSDLTSCQVGKKLAAEEVSQNTGDSSRQILRYIHLTELVAELLELADEKKLPFNTGLHKIAKFVLAVRRNYSDEVSFIPVKAFAKKAEFARDYLMQGTKVMVEGEIVTGNYEDKDTGKKIYTTEVYANRIEFAGAKMVDRPPFPEDAEGFLEIPEGMEEEMPFR